VVATLGDPAESGDQGMTQHGSGESRFDQLERAAAERRADWPDASPSSRLGRWQLAIAEIEAERGFSADGEPHQLPVKVQRKLQKDLDRRLTRYLQRYFSEATVGQGWGSAKMMSAWLRGDFTDPHFQGCNRYTLLSVATDIGNL